MNNISKFIIGTAVLTILTPFAMAMATTITKSKTTTPIPVPNTIAVDFSQFDKNKDGIYSMREVGSHLFYMFDKDGNEVIDNREWGDRTVITVSPVDVSTRYQIDFDDDGIADLSDYDHGRFFKDSGLVRFDKNRNGLSAREFLGHSLKEVDTSRNGYVNLKEFTQSYLKTIPAHNKPSTYNN